MRLLTLLMAFVFSVTRSALADGFDFDKFDQMDQASKFAVLDAGLKTREAALNNIEFTTKDHQIAWHSGLRKFVPTIDETRTTKMGFDRIYLYNEDKLYRYNEDEAKDVSSTGWQVGDKTEWRSLGIDKNSAGKVTQQAGNVVRGYPMVVASFYTEMLGVMAGQWLRPHGRGLYLVCGMCPMSDYLEAMWNDDGKGKDGYECVIYTHTDESHRKLIEMLLSRHSPDWTMLKETYDFMFDPNLGFMPYWEQRKKDAIKTKDQFIITYFTASVDSVQQVENVWVPSQVTRNGFMSLKDRLAAEVEVFKLLDCKLGGVTQADVADSAVSFPAGTTVVDDINKRGYFVNADATTRPIHIYDPDAATAH